jgi:purine-nucleoside phosphorylase
MTAHIEAKKDEIAQTVIMPGDPLRAKFIAETYLKDYKLVNTIRNIYAYTGYYKDQKITIMASGMGMPSIGIYSYELYKFYDVKNIIRVGTAGAYTKDLNLYDVVLVNASYSDSSYAKVQNNSDDKLIEASYATNLYISTTAEERNIPITIGNIYSSDVFYKEEDNYKDIVKEIGCIACEMESFALFHNAKVLNKRASCLLTISNSFVTNEETTAEERQNAFTKMIELALEASLKM